MSDETTPVTPPSTALYPTLVTPPESGNSIEDPILISDSDELNASDTEAFHGSVRYLSENSPSPSPRAAARLQPRKVRRHSRDVSFSGGDAKVETLDEVDNTREVNINNSDLGKNPYSSQVIIWQCANKISMPQLTTHLIGLPNRQWKVQMAVLLRKAVTPDHLSHVLVQPPRDQCRFGSWKSKSRRLS
jgi:hypothetical protein